MDALIPFIAALERAAAFGGMQAGWRGYGEVDDEAGEGDVYYGYGTCRLILVR